MKSPDVTLTLPIHIGNVSLDKKLCSKKQASSKKESIASVSEPDTAASSSITPRPAPKPAPRPRARISSHNSPSAPPADYHLGAEGGNLINEDFPNKRQSQVVSPNAFSYAPGLFFPQNQPPNASAPAPSGSLVRGSTGATAPMATQFPPPDYVTSTYPQGWSLCNKAC